MALKDIWYGLTDVPEHLRGFNKKDRSYIQATAQKLEEEMNDVRQSMVHEVKEGRFQDLWRSLSDSSDYTLSKTPSEFIREGFLRNTIAYRCIDTIADEVSTLNYYVYNQKDGALVEDPNHPLVKLLESPNKYQTSSEFLYAAETFKLTTGSAFIYMNKGMGKENKDVPPLQLEVLPSQRVKVKRSKYNEFCAGEYAYNPHGNEERIFPVDEKTGKSDIITVKFYNPSDPLIGLSPLQVALDVVSRHNQTNIWNLSLLKNGGRISQVWNFKDETLTRQQRDEIREEIERTLAGAVNAGRPAIVGGDVTISDAQISPKDMDYASSQLDAAVQIAGVYKIPPQVIGILEGSTYNNMAEAKLDFYEYCVIPEAKMLCEYLNRWLVPLYGDENLRIEFDMDAISALLPRREKKWAQVMTSDIHTINEKRVELGYEMLGPEADLLYIPANLIPITEDLDIEETPDTDEDEAEKSSVDYLYKELKLIMHKEEEEPDDEEEEPAEEEESELVGLSTSKENGHSHTLLEDGVTSEEMDHIHTWKEGDEDTSETMNHVHALPVEEDKTADEIIEEFQHEKAKLYAKKLMKEYGAPDRSLHNIVLWCEVEGMGPVIVRDKGMNFVYCTLGVKIPEKQEEALRKLSSQISINKLKGTITVRCERMIECAVILKFMEDMIANKFAPGTDLKVELAERLANS